MLNDRAVLLCDRCPAMLDPRGDNARRTAHLAWMLLAIAGAVFVAVLVMIAIAIWHSHGAAAMGEGMGAPDPKEHPAGHLTVIGGALPVVVLTGVLLVSFGPLSALSGSRADAVTIHVTAHRWWWDVEYPDLHIDTANEIHIPTGRPVRVLLDSDDVIHSFWVPQLAGKIDMVPGHTNELQIDADRAGTYRGHCAEYCGVGHSRMNFVVQAEQPAEFERWATHQAEVPPLPTGGTLLQGEQVVVGSACVYCHRIAGTNAQSNFGPDLTHFASRSTIGAGILPNNRGNLAGWILDAQHLKPGNAMPRMDLSGPELQDVLAYLESLR